MDLGPLLALAERQRGVLLREQLRAGDISWKVERTLVADGVLREIRSGAYAVGGRHASEWENAVAAALLCGPKAALSHSTAAAIHRFPGLASTRKPEVTVPRFLNPRLPGVTIHRVSSIPAMDVGHMNGTGVTTASRTLVDLAGRLNRQLLAQIIDEGTIARLRTIEELADCASRLGGQGRAGGRLLRGLLTERIDEPTAHSMLELRMIRTLAPFAPFDTQYHLVLDGELFILDIAWPWWKVGAEVDGWWSRSKSRVKLDQDSHKTNMLAAHGWKVAHLTSTMSQTTVLGDVGRLLPGRALPGVG
jgi:hypothetical protein